MNMKKILLATAISLMATGVYASPNKCVDMPLRDGEILRVTCLNSNAPTAKIVPGYNVNSDRGSLTFNLTSTRSIKVEGNRGLDNFKVMYRIRF